MRSFVLVSFVLASTIAACTVSTSSGTPAPTGDAGADGGGCATTGSGTVTVVVQGLPAGTAADVTITDPAGTARRVTANETFTSAAGTYRAAAARVIESGPIVRTVHVPTVDRSDFCLGDTTTTTLTVSYAPLPSSGKLWHSNANGDAQLIGFAGASLAASGSPAATVAAKAGVGRTLAFDREGNLWSNGGTTADAPIGRYAAATLGDALATKTPDVSLAIDFQCGPAISAIAFANDGALWLTSPCADKVVRYAPADIAASGTPAASVTLSGGGLEGPGGLAFDREGNLWVANAGAKTLLRYDVARLGASSDAVASLVIKAEATNGGELGPDHLAFDRDGNLFVGSFAGGIIYRLTPTELAGTGTKTLTPSVLISLSVNALPEGIAFDESGALWMPLGQGQIARLGAAQLTVGSTPGAPTTPEVILKSADTAYASAPAFFPAAKGTPIYAALP